MNKVKQIFNEVPDAELKIAVREMAELYETGILPNGVVRELVGRLVDQANITTHDAITIVQANVLKMAAFKWAKLSN